MLTAAENDLLTRTGPDTAMGQYFRRFWQPAALSEELPEADGPPIRLTVLGEELVAFRDSDGRVGVVDRRCPHRGADLFFGRNEECGLRCLYHGWKFDVTGRAVDLPNVPAGVRHHETVRLKAYPVREFGEIIRGGHSSGVKKIFILTNTPVSCALTFPFRCQSVDGDLGFVD